MTYEEKCQLFDENFQLFVRFSEAYQTWFLTGDSVFNKRYVRILESMSKRSLRRFNKLSAGVSCE